MNPSELRMMWMSQYNPNERITLEDNASFFNPNIGLSVMEDINQQQHQQQQQAMVSSMLAISNLE